jgi:integral membrane protein
MLRNAVGRLRLIGMIEAVSFLVLLGIAMPLKHIGGYPLPVRIVGWIHGLLFIAYCHALLGAATERGWPWTKNAKLFVAALLPFGPFVVDKGLRSERAGEA